MNDVNGKKYNLGIDIGTSSLGLVAIDICSQTIAHMDTIIYREPIDPKTFALFNVKRREKRSARRNLIRYKDRIRQLHHLFLRLGVNEDVFKLRGKNTNKDRDVIFLRAEAVKEKLSFVELLDVLCHVVKNRGYKGNLNSDGVVKEGIQKAKDEIKNACVVTFGELLKARRDQNKEKGFAWRNLQEGGTFLDRRMVEQEFCYLMFEGMDEFVKVWEEKNPVEVPEESLDNKKSKASTKKIEKKEWGYLNCKDAKLKCKYSELELDYEANKYVEKKTEEGEKEEPEKTNYKYFVKAIRKDIATILDSIYYSMFYQRPIIWDKTTIGECSHVKGLYVLPKISILFNEYRIWQKLQDLRIVEKNDDNNKVKPKLLTIEQLKSIKDYLDEKTKSGETYIKAEEIYSNSAFGFSDTEKKYKFSHDKWDLDWGKFEILTNKTLAFFYKELESKKNTDEDKEFINTFLGLTNKYNSQIDVEFQVQTEDKNNKETKSFKINYGALIQEGVLNYWSLLASDDELYMDEVDIKNNIKDFCYAKALSNEKQKEYGDTVYKLLMDLKKCSFFGLVTSKKTELDVGRSEYCMYTTKEFIRGYDITTEIGQNYYRDKENQYKNKESDTQDIKTKVIENNIKAGMFDAKEKASNTIASIDSFGIKNPIVKRSLEELRKSVLYAIKKLKINYGDETNNKEDYINKFAKITVEVTREMKTPPSQRQEIENDNKKREKENKKYAEELYKHNLLVNAKNITKYRLWEEQDKKCAYCVKNLAVYDIISAQVDHIIPVSKNGSNSLFNKVLAHFDCNNKKSDKTPQQWIKDSGMEDVKNAVNSLIKTLVNKRSLDKNCLFIKFKGKGKGKFCACHYCKKIRNLEFAKDPTGRDNDFGERALNETSYIGKFLLKWLEPLTKRWDEEKNKEVHDNNVTSGKITAFLRKHMGVENLLEEIRIEENKPLINEDGNLFSKALKEEIGHERDVIYKNAGMSDYEKEGKIREIIKEKSEHRNLKKFADFNFFKRVDHRHHLIDAAIIALTSRQLITAAQTYYVSCGSLNNQCIEYDNITGVVKKYFFEDRYWSDVLKSGYFKNNQQAFANFKSKFRAELKEKLINYVVWHKTNRFVNKEFVKEGVYSLAGGIKNPEIRKEIKDNSNIDVNKRLISRVSLGNLVDKDYANTLKNIEKKIFGEEIKAALKKQFAENYDKIKNEDNDKINIDRALKEEDLVRIALMGEKKDDKINYGIYFPQHTKNLVKKVRVVYEQKGPILYRNGKDLYKPKNNAVQISAGYNCAILTKTNVEVMTNLMYNKYETEQKKNKNTENNNNDVRKLFANDIIYYEPKGVVKGGGKFYLVVSFGDGADSSTKNKAKVKITTETNSFMNLIAIQGGIKKLLDKTDVKENEKKELQKIIENDFYKIIDLEKEKDRIRILNNKADILQCKKEGLGDGFY